MNAAQAGGGADAVIALDDDGNLRATVDYRSIYCSVLEQWLSTDAAAVVPHAKSFARVPLLR